MEAHPPRDKAQPASGKTGAEWSLPPRDEEFVMLETLSNGLAAIRPSMITQARFIAVPYGTIPHVLLDSDSKGFAQVAVPCTDGDGFRGLLTRLGLKVRG